MKVGYARISTAEQKLDLQIKTLKQAGCKKIFTDTVSGAKSEREGLAELNEYVREGDIVVVWKLDRLGRSLSHLIHIVTEYEERGIGFQSLTENIDTTTAGGKLVFHIFGALAEFERELTRERTKAGLNAARARGKKGGRPKKLKKSQVQLIKEMHENPDNKVSDIVNLFNISRSTLYRYLKEVKEDGE